MTEKTKSPRQLAEEIMEASKLIDANFREASQLVPSLLDGDAIDREGARQFRQLRRKWARFHSDMGEFADDYFPDVTTNSGGT